MKLVRRMFVFAAVASLVLAAPSARAEEEKPDATVHLESKSVAVGVGFSWGKGTLKYEGKEYPLEVDGLTVGEVGATTINAVGEVYNLDKLEDFNGTYTAIEGAAAAGGGAGALVMKNQNGVKIEMKSTSQGVNLTAGVSGVKLAIEK